MADTGTLYLLPAPLVEGAVHTLPHYVIEQLHRLRYFIAERAKTARHYIKATDPVLPFDALTFFELNKHTPREDWQQFLQPALVGHDIGLLSEAGCPGVADPGAGIVGLAHDEGVPVAPLVGPSSILLALMGSGMNGQSFCFHGYLSPRRAEVGKDLKRLEQLSQRHRQTQLFIETPYRNTALIEQALQVLQPTTRLCIAANLTGPGEYLRTRSVREWQRERLSELHKIPAIFCLEAAGGKQVK